MKKSLSVSMTSRTRDDVARSQLFCTPTLDSHSSGLCGVSTLTRLASRLSPLALLARLLQASSWLVAVVLLAIRWTMLWRSGSHSGNPILKAVESYPAMHPLASDLSLSPAVGLSVGLITSKHRKGHLSALPSFTELHSASLGLGALVVAWAGAVALQAASTATWNVWPWAGTGVDSVLPNTLYAVGMSTVCVWAVCFARVAANADGMAINRAEGLDSETAALAVASGWSWYNVSRAEGSHPGRAACSLRPPLCCWLPGPCLPYALCSLRSPL